MSAPSAVRFFRVAGITLQVACLGPGPAFPWHPKLAAFEVDGPGPDTVIIRHHRSAFPGSTDGPGPAVYDGPPYRVHAAGEGWIYRIGGRGDGRVQTALFAEDYSRADIYTPEPLAVPEQGFEALTLLPTDQVLLAPLLALRGGCLLHAAGVVRAGAGWLFAGHSTAGKSTITRMMKGRAEILCDDRIALRPDGSGGFRIHGTWSHGDVPDISPSSAPLTELFLLRKSEGDSAAPLPDRRDVARHLLDLVIKPLATTAWWSLTLEAIDRISSSLRAWDLSFSLSGGVLKVLDRIEAGGRGFDFSGPSR
jgi:hypothetical protein